MDLHISGKAALVTGSARGIGSAIALRLALEGARVAVNDIGNKAEAESTVQRIRESGGEAHFVQGDVSDEVEVERILSQSSDLVGPLDIVVNNAGIVSRKAILEVSADEWDRVLRTNLTGCFNCSRLAARRMVSERRQGRIVNISSIHGILAKQEMGAYCASKAAIDTFSKQLAVELAPHGIGVNVVACGAIRTDINIALYKSVDPKDRAIQQALLRRIPLGFVGDPDDIASAVAFLSSATAARYITGAVVYVDGGYTADGTARI